MTTNRRRFLHCLAALTLGSAGSARAAADRASHVTPDPGVAPPSASGRTPHGLLAAVGRTMRRYGIDPRSGGFTERQALELPADIFFACRHPFLPLLYVVGTDADTPGRRGPAQHYLATLNIGSGEKSLGFAAPPRPLPAFANHLATDPKGRMLVLACHAPSRVLMFGMERDGLPGHRAAEWDETEIGVFAHQVAFTPDGRVMTVCARGNDAQHGRPEEPGRLTWFHADGGRPVRQGAVTLEPGLGPRNLHFHPHRPWGYVGMERGNRLAMYDWEGNAPVRRQLVSTLAKPDRQAPRQRVGAVLVHPHGHVLYVANRADRIRRSGGQAVFDGGENTLAAFAIDPDSGAPRLLQRMETGGIEPRSIALDPSGRWLAVGNQITFQGEMEGQERLVPASVALFAVAADGTLVRQAHQPVTGSGLRWVGFPD